MKILLHGLSDIFLPMFSSRTSMLSWLIFKFFIHLEFIFVYGISWCSSFIFLHVADSNKKNFLKQLAQCFTQSRTHCIPANFQTATLCNILFYTTVTENSSFIWSQKSITWQYRIGPTYPSSFHAFLYVLLLRTAYPGILCFSTVSQKLRCPSLSTML